MNSQALQVTLVSSDRALLRQLSFLLSDFGYGAVACADWQAAQAALSIAPTDFLLVDEAALNGSLREIAALKHAAATQHVHVLLLGGDGGALDVREAFECGIDDFLKKPLSSGEVLARLRAGARYCEFERRIARQQWEDPVTGLWSEQALRDRLARELKNSSRARKLALVLVDLDLFRRVNASLGRTAGDQILRAVGRLLEEQCTPGQFVARLSGDRFAVMLPDHSVEKAAKLAERWRTSLAEQELSETDSQLRLTASLAVVGCNPDVDSPDSALARGEATLRDAKNSGRNCLVCAGQFDDERRAWSELVQSGNPFASCVARDVMTPFTVHVRRSDTAAFADALCAQMRLDVLSVVDAGGRFAGIVEREAIQKALRGSGRNAQPLEQSLQAHPPTIADTTPFETVIEHFIRHDKSLLVVMKGTRAQGYIARERFLALVKPVEPDQFSSELDYSPGSDYLVVPDLEEVEA